MALFGDEMAEVQRKYRKQKLSDLIVDEVKSMIVAKKLLPGDRLPNERDLIEQFGCS